MNNELLGPVRDRLEGVMVETGPYTRCLENYDSAETLFFLDPPYLKSDVGAYDGWTKPQMKDFRERVAQLKGRWIVTLDDSTFNRQLFDGCVMRRFEARNGAAKAQARARFSEMIVTPRW